MPLLSRFTALGIITLFAFSGCADEAETCDCTGQSGTQSCDAGAATDGTATDATPEQTAAERLAGLWHVVKWELTMPDGTVVKPFGDTPTGSIYFLAAEARFWGILNHSTDAPDFADGSSPFKGTPEESKAAHDAYIGYAGTYTIQEADSTVTLHVLNAWTPNWLGTDQVRKFTFTDNGQMILAPTNFEGNQLVFEKK